MGKRLAFGAAAVLVAVVCLSPVQTIYDDGLWPLSVTAVSRSGSPIVSVSCEAFSSKEWAQHSLENLVPPETLTYAAVADPFVGEPLAVPVPTSVTTRSGLVRSTSRYYQHRLLVVIVRYLDGRRDGRLVEIPDLRESRSAQIEFP